MPAITVGTENSGSIDLYYEDYGSGAIPWTHTDQVNKALLGFLGH
jgi:hypothetical protein